MCHNKPNGIENNKKGLNNTSKSQGDTLKDKILGLDIAYSKISCALNFISRNKLNSMKKMCQNFEKSVLRYRKSAKIGTKFSVF